MADASARSIPRGWRRLLTPGLGWVLVGLALALGCLAGIVLVDPVEPLAAWDDGIVALLVSLGTWGGLLLGTGVGFGAVLQGMVLLAAADRAEAVEVGETLERAPGDPERALARGGVAVLALVAAAGLTTAALLSRSDHGLTTVWVAVGALLVIGVLAGLFALPVARRGEAGRGEPMREAAFDRPVPYLHLGLLVGLTVLAVGLQLTLVKWIVEDAAISFAYARHLAAGEGLVTYPGGEPVEGYSNPLWTFLLAAWYLVGVDGFVSNKIMAAVFAALTVPLTFLVAREARPHRADPIPLVAAAILASGAQFTIWGGGGLENSLLNVLIALAIWRTLVEARHGGWPWSSAAWLGVALTRPDGILYAALGGFWSMVFRAVAAAPAFREARASGRGIGGAVWAAAWPTLAWLLTFFGPFALYQAWRLDTFGWELPNTYYAKKGNPSKAFEPFRWTRKGWKYTRRWAHELGHGYLMPVYLLGMLGRRGVRGAAWTACVIALAIVLLPGPEWLTDFSFWTLREPPWWVGVRVWTLLGVAVVAALLAVGRPGWRALVLCEGVAAAAIFFAIYAGGDWMNGFRWMATFAVPGAVVLAVGFGEAADAAADAFDRGSWVPGAVLAGVLGLLALAWAVPLAWPPTGRIPTLGFTARDPDLPLAFAVPVALGLAVVLGRLSRRRRRTDLRWGPGGWAVAFALLAAVTLPSIHHLDVFLGKPTTSPWKVKKRVNYMNYVQARVHMEGRPTTLDVDMGANMYWSGDAIVDIAGLVDVPMGHHWFDRPFLREYIFEERQPDFAHVHGGWARTSRLKTFDAWDETFLELPPYPTSRTGQHGGNHIARRHLIAPTWEGTRGRRMPYEGGMVLEGWEAPVAGVAGGHVYLEVAWSTVRELQPYEAFRTVAFLASDDHVHSWDVPVGYDWYPPEEWSTDEVVFGRYSLPVPEDLPPGRYDLGFVMIDGDGAVVAPGASVVPVGGAPVVLDLDPGRPDGPEPRRAEGADGPAQAAAVLAELEAFAGRARDWFEAAVPVPLPEGAVQGGRDGVPARVSAGELRWVGAVEIVSPDEARARSEADLAAALQHAADDECDAGEARWRLARRRLTRTRFDEEHHDDVAGPLAACWARAADLRPTREGRVEAFARAHDWDHRDPTLRRLARPVAEALQAEGEAARAAQDWETAYAAFRDALRIDPDRPWARRYAEEARDCRLGIRLDEHDCGQRVEDEVDEEAAERRRSPLPRRALPDALTRPTPRLSIGDSDGDLDDAGGGPDDPDDEDALP